jgi:hypothetical protein
MTNTASCRVLVSGRWASDVHCFAATWATVLVEGRTMTQPIRPPW